MARKTVILFPDTERALQNAGANIKRARLRRNLCAELVAERAGISVDTLSSIEKGVSTVSIGAYAAVLHSLGVEKDLELLGADEEQKRRYREFNLKIRKRATPREKKHKKGDGPMIYITGDCHGDFEKFDIDIFPEQKEMTKEDFVIICGDFGGIWEKDVSGCWETKLLDELDSKPFTTLFVDGNHENFERLNSYGVTEWNGGKVHLIEKDIIHLMRGQVYTINETKFFTFGGAYSIDKWHRTKGITWFPEELPTKKEMEEGWYNLEKVDFKVDYILSHTAPWEIIGAMGYRKWSDDEIGLRRYLQRVAENTDFITWYFGHFHEDTVINDKFICLYDKVVELQGRV